METTPDIQRWINNRAKACVERARNKRPSSEWRRAIKKAVEKSNGRCPYTGIKLDFTLPSYDPFYPSLDRKGGLDSTNLDITSRIVNGMKSIMSEKEFLAIVAQIYAFRGLKPPRELADEKAFKPRRRF